VLSAFEAPSSGTAIEPACIAPAIQGSIRFHDPLIPPEPIKPWTIVRFVPGPGPITGYEESCTAHADGDDAEGGDGLGVSDGAFAALRASPAGFVAVDIFENVVVSVTLPRDWLVLVVVTEASVVIPPEVTY
jgi:hypothetical protein